MIASLFDPPEAPRSPASTIALRDYQREALDAIHAARTRAIDRQLISLPTGAGKTILASYAVSEVGLPTVMLVHRDELVRQSVDKLRQVNPDLSVGVVQAEMDQLGRDITVASVQTLAHQKRLDRLHASLPTQRFVISDECHHDPAPTRLRTIRTLEPSLLVGLTATPTRLDNLGLGNLYQEIVYHLPMIELIARGQLAPLRGLRIETDTSLDAVHTVAGELAEGELADTVNTEARNRLIVEAWQTHAQGRGHTVAFCVNVAHATALRDAFRTAGVDAEMVIGTTSSHEREHIYRRFHSGDLPVMTGCMVFTEGWDEPALDCVLMARPTKSKGLYIQMVGRGARTHAGKGDCLVIDFVDVSSRHSLVTFPSLAGLDVPDGVPLPSEATEQGRAEGEVVDLLELCQKGVAMREKRAVAVNLFGQSPYVWRETEGTWAAKAGASSWLVLWPSNGGFLPQLVDQGAFDGPSAKPLFDRALDLDLAMGVAEAKLPRNELTTRAANWRQREDPPTPKQVEYGQRLGIPDPAHLSKAQLSELIDDRVLTRTLRRLKKQGGVSVT